MSIKMSYDLGKVMFVIVRILITFIFIDNSTGLMTFSMHLMLLSLSLSPLKVFQHCLN